MGIWIVVAIVLFVLGSMMALKPSGIDIRLDTLRMSGRKLGLNPKLVACPDWVIGKDGEYGRGMIGQYGLVLEGVKLPLTRYQVIDGQWRPLTTSSAGNSDAKLRDGSNIQNKDSSFALDKVALDLPETIEPYIKALATQANSILVYWEDITYVRPATNPHYRKEAIETDLLLLKSQLEKWAQRLQGG